MLEAERVMGQADEASAWARAVETAHAAALVGDLEWARGHVETRFEAGLSPGAVFGRNTAIRLIELLPLTESPRSPDAMIGARGRELANVYARIQTGDTVGLRAVVETLPLHLFQRALVADRLGDVERTIQLFEAILRPGYTSWGSDLHRLRAMLRLGPLYEQAGDTLRAMEAYQGLARRWDHADARGREVATGFAERARTLGAALTSDPR